MLKTDMKKLREVVPEPLEIHNAVVHYEFIKMPDSSKYILAIDNSNNKT